MADRIGFLGPGLMGKGIVKNLLKKGFPVTVFAHRAGLNLDDLKQAGAAITTALGKSGRRAPTSSSASHLPRKSRRQSLGRPACCRA
jgi:3-hydroxyacyl-CoA dehydrogenase